MKAVAHVAVFILALLCAPPSQAEPAFSPAEQHLLLDAHLLNVDASATLHYRYRKSGTLEDSYQDEVRLMLEPAKAGAGKHAHVEYLSGAHALSMPDLEAALANPVVLYFLERDVREMQRLTGGQAAYFRKRVRLALADAAQVTPARIEHAGRDIDAVEIVLQPYAQDTLRARFARYAHKTYRFVLSPTVPGMVVELHTVVADPRGGALAPLLEERLSYERSQP